jgi:hypothetical protein
MFVAIGVWVKGFSLQLVFGTLGMTLAIMASLTVKPFQAQGLNQLEISALTGNLLMFVSASIVQLADAGQVDRTLSTNFEIAVVAVQAAVCARFLFLLIKSLVLMWNVNKIRMEREREEKERLKKEQMMTKQIGGGARFQGESGGAALVPSEQQQQGAQGEGGGGAAPTKSVTLVIRDGRVEELTRTRQAKMHAHAVAVHAAGKAPPSLGEAAAAAAAGGAAVAAAARGGTQAIVAARSMLQSDWESAWKSKHHDEVLYKAHFAAAPAPPAAAEGAQQEQQPQEQQQQRGAAAELSDSEDEDDEEAHSLAPGQAPEHVERLLAPIGISAALNSAIKRLGMVEARWLQSAAAGTGGEVRGGGAPPGLRLVHNPLRRGGLGGFRSPRVLGRAPVRRGSSPPKE